MNTQTLYTGMIALPFLAAPLVYLLGRLSVRKGKSWGIVLARVLAVVTLVVDIVLLLVNLKNAMAGQEVSDYIGMVMLRFDGIGLLLAAVVLVLGLMVTIFSIPYMAKENNEEKFHALLLMTIGSIMGIGFTQDLFNMWIWFEAMAISTYFLVAFYNEQPASLEAGLKYLVQSAVGSALVLFGIAAVLSGIGSTDFLSIWQLSAQLGGLGTAGVVLMIVGFGVKAALVPLHTWLPDAHSQAPSGMSAMLSGVVIEAGLIAMLRAISLMGKLGGSWGTILIGFACLNILVGNLMALRQTEVKRLLAYSSLAHVGYMLFGFGLGFAFMSGDGGAGGFFHLITHALMKGLAFMAAGALLYTLHLSKGDHKPLVLDDLNGASRKYPLVAIALSVAVLALGGMPPFAGFMSKWLILVAGAETHNTWVLVGVVFVGLNSVLSLGYYAPIVNRLFKKETSPAVESGTKVPWLMVVPMVILVALIVFIGIWPTSLEIFYGNAVNTLLTYFFS